VGDEARELLDSILACFVLEEDRPRYVGTGTGALPWRFGRPGSPVARGIDILTIRDVLREVGGGAASRLPLAPVAVQMFPWRRRSPEAAPGVGEAPGAMASIRS
jgi:hypothetical protein